MNLFWVVLLTAVSVAGGTSLCLWLLYKAHEAMVSEWILEHVICPIIRILVLLFIVSLVYPAVNVQSGALEFWSQLGRHGQFNDLLNILFFAGLGLSFLPVVSHPVFALPVQSMLTIALVFSWQHAALGDSLVLLPSLATLAKVIIYMTLAYFVTREASAKLSRWLDERFHIEGSIRLVSDSIYLVLQIPVMLLYCSFLRQQLPVTGA